MPLEKVLNGRHDRKKTKTSDSLILGKGVWRRRARDTDCTQVTLIFLTDRFSIILEGKHREKYNDSIVTHCLTENSSYMLQILTSTLQYEGGANKLVWDDWT